MEKASFILYSTSNFVALENLRLEETDASYIKRKTFFSSGEILSGTAYFYSLSHLSSVHELSDVSGAAQARYFYSPFGKPLKISGGVNADFQFSGYYVHSRSGLNFTSTRVYDCMTGRFLSRDRIMESSSSNLYSYTGNSPTNFRDPSGQDRVAVDVSDNLRSEASRNLDAAQLGTILSGLFSFGKDVREHGGGFTWDTAGDRRIGPVEQGTPTSINSFQMPHNSHASDIFETHAHLGPGDPGNPSNTPPNDIAQICGHKDGGGSTKRLWVAASNGCIYMFDGYTCSGCQIIMTSFCGGKGPVQCKVDWCRLK